jgi:hypothetical protein
MKTEIKTAYSSVKPVNGALSFVGRVLVYENGKHLYSESTGINRLTSGDALYDADQLKNDILSQNGIAL